MTKAATKAPVKKAPEKVLGVKEKTTAPKVVKGKVVATDMGYYKGEIIRAGKEFQYEGLGKFPRWVEVLKDESPKAGPVKEKEEAGAPAESIV